MEEGSESDNDNNSSNDEDDKDVEVGEEEGTGAKIQKKYIHSLKDKETEFYKFLKQEDTQLLNFDDSDSDDDEKEGGEDDNEEGKVHKLPEKLEVASDESDYEDEESESKMSKAGKITKTAIDTWTEALEREPTQSTINSTIEAFRAAMNTVGSGARRGL